MLYIYNAKMMKIIKCILHDLYIQTEIGWQKVRVITKSKNIITSVRNVQPRHIIFHKNTSYNYVIFVMEDCYNVRVWLHDWRLGSTFPHQYPTQENGLISFDTITCCRDFPSPCVYFHKHYWESQQGNSVLWKKIDLVFVL